MDRVEKSGGSILAQSQLRPSVQWASSYHPLDKPDPYCISHLVEVATRVTAADLSLVGLLTHGQTSLCGLVLWQVVARARYTFRQLPP